MCFPMPLRTCSVAFNVFTNSVHTFLDDMISGRSPTSPRLSEPPRACLDGTTMRAPTVLDRAAAAARAAENGVAATRGPDSAADACARHDHVAVLMSELYRRVGALLQWRDSVGHASPQCSAAAMRISRCSEHLDECSAAAPAAVDLSDLLLEVDACRELVERCDPHTHEDAPPALAPAVEIAVETFQPP
jgi:hypothetical protein